MKRFYNCLSVIAIVAVTLLAYIIIETENQPVLLGSLLVIVLAALALDKLPQGRELAQSLSQLGRHSVTVVFASGLVIALALYQNHFALLMLTTVLIYATACIGLTVQFGFGGVINFAGAAFFGVGGYTAAVLGGSGVPSLLILIIGGVLAAILGCLLILPILRTKGHYAALITIAFGLLFRSFLEVNDGLGGPQGLKVKSFNLFGWNFEEGITIGSFEASYFLNYALLALVLFSVVLLFARLLEKSWIGLSLDVVREDEIAAASFGLNTSFWRILSFVIGNLIIGVSGALYAMMQNFVAPGNFGFGESLLLIAIVILGGLGNLWGLLPATILVLVAPEKFQEFGEYRILIFSLIIVLILRFSPSGLFPRKMRSYGQELKK